MILVATFPEFARLIVCANDERIYKMGVEKESSMNFKRLVIATFLAASQVAMVLPASAEEAVPNTPRARRTYPDRR